MVGKIEHIGIAVKDLQAAVKVYEKLLGTAAYKQEKVESEKVTTAFFKTGENKVELLQGLDTSSAISRFIEKNGEGLHHVAFAVEDVKKEAERLEKRGFSMVFNSPKPGADNKLINFVHPKKTNGLLVEICENIS